MKRKNVFGFDNDSDDDNDRKDEEPLSKKRKMNFDESDEEEENDSSKQSDSEAEEDDPLDAFMEGINDKIEKQNNEPSKSSKQTEEVMEQEDHIESFLEHRSKSKDYNKQMTLMRKMEAKRSKLGSAYNSDEEVYQTADAVDEIAEYNAEDYDSPEELDDKGRKRKRKNGNIDLLPPKDHSQIAYPEFEKDFYEEHSEIKNLDEQVIQQFRKDKNLYVSGYQPPRPILKWEHGGFDELLMGQIHNSGYDQPTPIQSQAIPTALSGRDVLGIAQTGSGKTAAYLFPLIMHIMDQEELQSGDGPIGLVLAPTRELAQQIYVEAKKFSRAYHLRTVAIYGGASISDQIKALRKGSDIVVATPGRMIDLLKKKACKLDRVTYLVFDEADRMFDMGFEPQVRCLIDQVRPDRQMLMFSATLSKKIESLVRDALEDEIRISVGRPGGQMNEDVRQDIIVLDDDHQKWNVLMDRLRPNLEKGSVIIFVSNKNGCDELASNLCRFNFMASSIHGDKDQEERDEVLSAFRRGYVRILVATDVAARGLDIPHVKTVINFDIARDIDSHIHRIGRTGRAGDKEGVAITFITRNQSSFAVRLVRSLEQANNQSSISNELMNVAMQNSRFRRQRKHRGGFSSSQRGSRGKGRGRWRRQGLGFQSSSDSSSSLSFSSSKGNFNSSESGSPSFVKASSTSESNDGEIKKPIVFQPKKKNV
eukprot:gb/GECH01015032.1/.p1 GENE.gb/GECH01015032.1/~~gb/GECH01015032.1/.p1  ORF type:complete len:705 (+),score=243.97 gb/GECH01015032.1/:1-2115(+)